MEAALCELRPPRLLAEGAILGQRFACKPLFPGVPQTPCLLVGAENFSVWSPSKSWPLREKLGPAPLSDSSKGAEIQDMSKCLAARLCLSGFYGLDFVIEEATGALFLIELNPRCTQLGHLVLRGAGRFGSAPSADAWVPRARIAPSLPSTAARSRSFRKRLPGPPTAHTSIKVTRIYHGVNPGLARKLLRDIWPERRWPQRLYRRLRGRHPDPKPHLENLASSERECFQKMLGQLR